MVGLPWRARMSYLQQANTVNTEEEPGNKPLSSKTLYRLTLMHDEPRTNKLEKRWWTLEQQCQFFSLFVCFLSLEILKL